MTDKVTFRSAADIKPKAPPVCEVCGKYMWWQGSSGGWGCPIPDGSPECRSHLFRPKKPRQGSWPYADRYPELVDSEQADG